MPLLRAAWATLTDSANKTLVKWQSTYKVKLQFMRSFNAEAFSHSTWAKAEKLAEN